MKHEESIIQAGIVQFLQLAGVFFFAVSNELAGGNLKRNMLFKAMGMRAGTSDLVVVLPEGKVLFIEVKTQEGKQSDKQVAFQKKVESLGHKYFVVRGVDDVKKILYP